MTCGGATLYITTYYVPLYVLFIHGNSELEAIHTLCLDTSGEIL